MCIEINSIVTAGVYVQQHNLLVARYVFLHLLRPARYLIIISI